tara:strand:- start:1132 stop:1509 length:378 start_codon:yes stop_codon:yes gene_type:complete
MNLIKCNKKYWEFVRLIRTHSKNIEGFFKNNEISKEEQIEYMKLNSKYFYICLIDNIPVGWIKVYNNEISYCVHPDFKGKGIGTYMVNEVYSKYDILEAYVKTDNIASQKVFEKVGFTKYINYKK